MNRTKEFLFQNSKPQRLDAFMCETSQDSRTSIQKNIISGNILLNGRMAKPSSQLKTGDLISLSIGQDAAVSSQEPSASSHQLSIIFENKDLIVVDKSPGMAVHPSTGNQDNTVVNALLGYHPNIIHAVADQSNQASKQRPGIVHRLDKDTSGILLVAKNLKSLNYLSSQIRQRRVEKIYLAICYGWPEKEKGALQNYLGRNPKSRKKYTEVGIDKGKVALSDYRVLRYFETKRGLKLSEIEFNIHTGRTHQIRVQSLLMGHPVLGDHMYYTKESHELTNLLSTKRQLLHSYKYIITLESDQKPSAFTAPIPKDFLKVTDNVLLRNT